MAIIKPFRGLFYNYERVRGTDVVAPPYDIISSEYQQILYDRSPYNIVRIDFGKDLPGDNNQNNKYSRASMYLRDWIKDGIVVQDKSPAFYIYEANYKINGIQKQLTGFMGTVRLEPIGTGCIHPHEMTRPRPKEDRLNVLRYCLANISPIFGMYSCPMKWLTSVLEKAKADSCIIEAKDMKGHTHRLWPVYDIDSLETITQVLAKKDIFIADGHHRYETALAFKDELDSRGYERSGNELYRYVMMFLTNMEDEGFHLLPTHRLVKGISKDILNRLNMAFHISAVAVDNGNSEQAIRKLLTIMAQEKDCLGLYLRQDRSYYLLKYDIESLSVSEPEVLKNLGVTILHKVVFDRFLNPVEVKFEMDPVNTIHSVNSGDFEAAFFLNSTQTKDVHNVAMAHLRMPPKSTYFYPKLLTGMVMYLLNR